MRAFPFLARSWIDGRGGLGLAGLAWTALAARAVSAADGPFDDEVPDATLEATKTFWEMLAFGWQINLVLGVLAFLTLAYFFYLWMVTRSRRVAPPELVRRILDDLASGAYETAQVRLEQYPSLFSAAFLPGLLLHAQPAERIQRAVEAAGRRAVGSLRQRAALLANVGVLAPMLGLLGTVMGLMKAFNVMTAEIGQSFRTQMLSAAIGEAMVTTAVGLIVGIPAMALYFLMISRIGRAADTVEEAAETATARLEDLSRVDKALPPG